MGLRRPLYPAGNHEKQELKVPISLPDFDLLAQDNDQMPGTVVGIRRVAKKKHGLRSREVYRTNTEICLDEMDRMNEMNGSDINNC